MFDLGPIETRRQVRQYLDDGRHMEALVLMQKAIAAHGLTVDHCLLLAEVFERMGRVPRAIELLERTEVELRSDARVAAMLERLRQPN